MVILSDWCPSNSATLLTDARRIISHEANLCRRSCQQELLGHADVSTTMITRTSCIAVRWASGVPLIVCRHGRPGWLQASAHNPSRPLPTVATIWYWINKLRDRQPSGRPRLAATAPQIFAESAANRRPSATA